MMVVPRANLRLRENHQIEIYSQQIEIIYGEEKNEVQ